MDLLLFIFGVLIGWGINHYYSSQTAREAREAAAQAKAQLDGVQSQLLRVGEAFAQIAQDKGLVEWTRDPDGKITFGRVVRQAFTASYDIGGPQTDELKAGPATIAGTGEAQPKYKSNARWTVLPKTSSV